MFDYLNRAFICTFALKSGFESSSSVNAMNNDDDDFDQKRPFVLVKAFRLAALMLTVSAASQAAWLRLVVDDAGKCRQDIVLAPSQFITAKSVFYFDNDTFVAKFGGNVKCINHGFVLEMRTLAVVLVVIVLIGFVNVSLDGKIRHVILNVLDTSFLLLLLTSVILTNVVSTSLRRDVAKFTHKSRISVVHVDGFWTLFAANITAFFGIVVKFGLHWRYVQGPRDRRRRSLFDFLRPPSYPWHEVNNESCSLNDDNFEEVDHEDVNATCSPPPSPPPPYSTHAS